RGGLQDTHLDVFEVVGAVDGAYVVGHLTETGTPVVDAVQVVFRQGVQNFTANLAIQQTLHGLFAVHQEGQVEQVHFRLEVGQVAGGRNGDVNQTHLGLLNDLDV